MIDRVSPGQGINLSASRENRIAAAVEFVERLQREPMNLPKSKALESNYTLAKNSSATDIPMFGVVEAIESLFVPTDNLPQFQQGHPLKVNAPTSSAAGRFGIALEPIAAGKFGRVQFDGLVVCQVDITDPALTTAGEIVGDATKLRTSASGSARIITREAGSSGTKWALVHLGTGGGGDAESLFLVDPANTSLVGGSDPPQWYYHLLPGEINVATGVVTAISGGSAVKAWNLYEDQTNWGHGQPITLTNGATITPSKVLGPVRAKSTGQSNGGFQVWTFDLPCPADAGCGT
jgi:hypothetical protein